MKADLFDTEDTEDTEGQPEGTEAAEPMFSALTYGRKPIAQHNAEMAAHMEKFFPADPGKSPRVFRYDEARQAYIAIVGPMAEAATPCAGFLNYDDKFEMLDGMMLVRRDMTDAVFAALPAVETRDQRPETKDLQLSV